MPKVFETSTDDVSPRQRMDFWRAGAREIGGLTHSIDNSTKFEGWARLSVLEKLKLGRFRVSANEARWTHDLIRQAEDPFLRFWLQCDGTAQVEQGEARFTLDPGQWTLLNASRPHAFRATETIEGLVVIVPRSALSPRLFESTSHAASAYCLDQGIARLLFDFARSVLDEVGPGSAKTDEYLAGAGMELVKAVLQERFDNRAISTCREIRVERIRSYIDRHLSDPTLSVQTIAEAMGCSRRYVHALFAGEESVHDLIWGTRLKKAANDLRRKELIGTSITTVALSHGFSCPAHFSRTFKARYGLSPRDYRHRLLDS